MTTRNITHSLENASTSQSLENVYGKDPGNLFQEVFFFISPFISLAGNILVLFTLWKSPNLKKIQHHLVGNLAVGDLGSSITIVIFNLPTSQLDGWVFGDFICTLSGFLLQMFSFQTIITLACISIDRYHAICYALYYNAKMTKNKCRLMILVSWLYPILSCSPPFYGWGHYRYVPHLISCMMIWGPHAGDISFSAFQGLACWFAAAVIIFCYIKIWKQSRETFITSPLRINQHGETQENSTANLIKKELRVAKMIIIIIIVFVITWVPFVVLQLVQKYAPQDYVDTQAIIMGEKVTLILFTCSTFVNPIIYSVVDRRFRREVTRVCSRRGTSSAPCMTPSATRRGDKGAVNNNITTTSLTINTEIGHNDALENAN